VLLWRGQESEIASDHEVAAKLLGRSFCHLQESTLIGVVTSPATFSDVRPDGHGGPPYLRRKAKSLIQRKGSRKSIRAQRE
jgi:hypothetical protein